MWSEIPRHTSYGTGYCLGLIGVALGFMSSMMGAWFLAKPGGPFSALTVENSLAGWLDLSVLSLKNRGNFTFPGYSQSRHQS